MPNFQGHVTTSLIIQLICSPALWSLHKPAPVDEYEIHADGGLIYDPLRREAKCTGQLDRYENVEVDQRELVHGPYRLTFAVPRRAKAYEVIPIKYELTWTLGRDYPRAGFPVAVEAVAFEDETRRRGRDLFDLALPDKLDLDVEYLGSITAHLIPGAKHNLKPDMSDTPGEYPPFKREPFVRSGVVEAGDLVWFKFRYTNTGDTILDPEGLGGCQLYPELYRRNATGEYEFVGNPYNLYVRDLSYLYPGESHETWIHFQTPAEDGTPQSFGLIPGEYRIRFIMTYRWYKEYAGHPHGSWHPSVINIWDGPPMFIWEMPIVVEPQPRQAPVSPGETTLTNGDDTDKITRFIHTFEEFMTAFDCHIAPSLDSINNPSITGTLHLQVAPWTKHVVVKLIRTGPVSLASVAVPIDVDSDSLRIEFDPDHQMNVIKDGLCEPVIFTQCMADMRTNVQIGPFPEQHIRKRVREMMDHGINLAAVTEMLWLYDDGKQPESNYHGDAYKYFLDIARQEGLWIEGWGVYPFYHPDITNIYNWLTGENVEMDTYQEGYHVQISYTDPFLPAANAAIWLYQFKRWGDLYYQMGCGTVPLAVEDTRGWLRQDNNVRYPIGRRTLSAFQQWVKQKYGTIEAVNRAWQSNYTSFENINPEQGQKVNEHGHLWEYSYRSNPFHDWNQAVEDFDRFRTEVRVDNYRDTLEIVQKEIPTAAISPRTEGANILVNGIDPESPNAHFRHIYYSQRRCALIADIVQESQTVKIHSDYTTIPYTPTELRKLIRMSISQGVIPCLLPNFDNMRDMAINQRYGTDYQVHYNLDAPKMGYMMHCLTALYPWFKVVYEEGGTPGVMWEDYQCDGFVTETQKREMQFFMKKLGAALSTPEAKKSRMKNGQPPPQDWRKKCRAIKCYFPNP